MVKKFTVKRIAHVMVALTALITGLLLFGTKGKALNPYMPMWEHIPDGEPYIFEDPDNEGTYRLYVYGSHDTRLTDYCGHDLVVWSAPLDDLTDWRYDGVIFESEVNGVKDVLFAPDVAVVDNEDGTKSYYLYPNNQAGGRNGMVAVSDSPKGPFSVCNWSNAEHTANDGVLGFDPAVFVDDDGRVYGYWGFQKSYMAELDPDTMATVKDGCEVLTESETGIDDSNNKNGIFRFFEASSIRKIKMNGQSKYVFVYSRKSQDNEFGMGASNATLAYAYSDEPLGPWTYGGTIVDARARQFDKDGKVFASYPGGNTHGSIVEVNGQWYIFYHRCINEDQFSRQGTAEPIEVNITDDGKVVISEAEVTSQGVEINGLNPYRKTSAGVMCYRIGSPGSSYVKATYDKEVDSSPVVRNMTGGIIGYKYFNFDLPGWQHLTGFDLDIKAKGVNGTITLMIDSPWESKGGEQIGAIDVSSEDDVEGIITKHVNLEAYDKLAGKHALYMVFDGPSNKEIADIYDMVFTGDGVEPSPSPTVTPVPTSVPETASPSPSAMPSAMPSAASQTPSAEMSAAPDNVQTAVRKFVVNKLKFSVTSGVKGKETVVLTGTTNSKISSLNVPAVVKYMGVTYSVTGIKANAFAKCRKLKSVKIGRNITSIGSKAFANCKALKKVTVNSGKITVIGKSVFLGTPVKKKISVPKGKEKAYAKLFRK